MQTTVAAPKPVEKQSQPAPASGSGSVGLGLLPEQGAQAGLPIYLQCAGLQVGAPDDPYEREADRFAAAVKGQTAQSPEAGSSRRRSLSRLPIYQSAGTLKPPDGGQPIAAPLRTEFESSLGVDLGHVRIHNSAPAAAAAGSLHAKAFTNQNHIWLGSNQSPHDKGLLAHEVTHVVQQSSGAAGAASGAPAAVQRIPMDYDPPSTRPVATPRPAVTSEFLAGQSLQMLAVDQQLSAAHPETAEQRAALEETLVRAVRLNAIGLMSSHRAAVEEAQARLEGRTRFPVQGEPPPQSTSSVLVEMREAAQMVNSLRTIEERLDRYRSELHSARSRALFDRGSMGDTLEMIAVNGAEFMDEDLRTGLRNGWESAQRMGSYRLWAYGAANALLQLREQQITGIRLAISEVYTRFPLFAELEPSAVTEGSLSSDVALLAASRRAYERVLEKIDGAISNIANSSGIHPFDMPKAVEATRVGKPPAVQQALNEAVERHEMNRFWLTMGLTAAEILLCFIPVVGPALALGLGGVALGMTLDDMLDRVAVARASTDPHDSPVGVQEPSAFEWTMVGVAGLLAAFGGAGIARSAMRGFRNFQALSRLAPELGAGSRMRLARLMTNQPELIAAPRTSGALSEQLSAAGVELSTAEVQALRAASYQRAGLAVPRTSGESLDAFLDGIWNERQTVLRDAENYAARARANPRAGFEPSDAVYDRYSATSQPNRLQQMSNEQYLNRLEQLRAGRSPEAVSNLQNPRNPEGTFHRFERPGFDPTRVRERIYLNVQADQAPDVMEFVVRNIVDDPSVPGVQMAKISGPRAVGGRADAIVIYLDDTAAAETVLARLRQYQQSGVRGFRPGGPALTEEVMEGVSVSQEPAAMHRGASFGTVRSRAVYNALRDTTAAGGGREQFIDRVRELLRASGVNPEAPHLNLPAAPAGPPPPPSGGIGGTPVMPALLLGQGSRDDR